MDWKLLWRKRMTGNGVLKKIAIVSCVVLAVTALLTPVVHFLKIRGEAKGLTDELEEQNQLKDEVLSDDQEGDKIPDSEDLTEDWWSQVPGLTDSPVFKELNKYDYSMIILEKKDLLNDSEIILEDYAVERSILITITKYQGIQYDGAIYRVRDNCLFAEAIPESEDSKSDSLELSKDLESNSSGAAEDLKMDSSESEALLQKEDNSLKQGLDHQVYTKPRLDSDAVLPTDPVLSAEIQVSQDSSSAILQFWLDKTYAYEIREDNNYFYICLRRAKDIYPKIVVVDAGHGGIDYGTYSKDYTYWEKDMNLAILLELKQLLDEQKEIQVYYTRTEDRRLTLNQRVDLANDLEADLFLSIHCNSNPTSSVHGTEVLFNELQDEIEGFNSREFALICAEEVSAQFGLKNRGIIPRSSNVHIIGAAQMPVALVEMAYMTNREDLAVLIQKERQQAAAVGMYHAILKGYERIEAQRQ